MNFPVVSNPEFYSALSMKQEGFAEAHIRAVCASLGCGISKPDPDVDKIDFTIYSKVRGTYLNKPKFDIQSKCKLVEHSITVESEYFKYTIDGNLYENLRDDKVAIPRILILTLVPNECKYWIEYNHRHTKLCFCSYWFSLVGMDPLPNGQKSKTISIPTRNVFSAQFLHNTMQKIADGIDPFKAEVNA